MVEAFGYIFCFAVGFVVAILFSWLALRDLTFHYCGPIPEENETANRDVLKQWKKIGLAGGLLGVAYFGLAPRDPDLQLIITHIWQFVTGGQF